MNLLFLSRWYPYPPDNGSKIRVFNLIKQLSKHHEITLLSFAQETISEERATEMTAYCRSVRTVPRREFSPSRMKALFGLLSTRPRSLFDTHSLAMQALVEEESRINPFDIIIASQIESTEYAFPAKETPRVFEEVELSVIYEQFAGQRSLVYKFRYGLTWWKLARFLANMLHNFEGCTVVSEQERDLVTRIDPEYDSVRVVPNGVDVERNTGKFGSPKLNTLIYSGALTYRANFDAMKFFLGDIFPLVKASCPEVSLQITGRHDGVPVDRLSLGNGARLTGYLDDIRPAIAQSWACVIPLRVGGGSRLKILEAMALGTPVISTLKGAEGLGVTHNQNILIADTPHEFAQAVLRLLRDKDLRARLSRNARELVEKNYSWDQSGAKLEQFLCEVVGKVSQQKKAI